MLNQIITFSVRQKFVALSLVILMAVAGYFSLSQLPINSLPDVTPGNVRFNSNLLQHCYNLIF